MPDDEKNDAAEETTAPIDENPETEEGLDVDDGSESEESESKEETTSDDSSSATGEDDSYLELKKTGLTAAQIRQYAHEGWKSVHNKSTDTKTKTDQDTEDESSEEYLPVTKKEMAEAISVQRDQARNESAAMLNQAKVDALLDTDRDASSHKITRNMIEGAVWQKVSEGHSIPNAFKLAKKEWKGYVGGVNKEYATRKVKTRANPGSLQSSAMSDIAPPTKMKHSADDFNDGTALEDALAFARQIDPAAFR